MMRGSQAIGIDTNPVNSIAITLADANVNSLKAIDIITSEIKKKHTSISMTFRSGYWHLKCLPIHSRKH